MRRKILCATLLLALCASFSANASEARSDALLYNLAFEDMTDIFIFPNLLPQYEGLYFHLPADLANAYGGLIFNLDSDSSVGVFIHRPLVNAFDQYRLDANNIGASVAGIQFNAGNRLQTQLAGQLFDVMYGTGKWGVGLRMHVWSEASEQESPLADQAETASAITGELNTAFRLMDGMNLRGSVGFRNVADQDFTLLFQVGGRYLSPSQKRIRPVAAAELQVGIVMPDQGDTSFAFMLPFKGGMRFEAIADKLYLGLLGGLDLQMYKPGGGDTMFGLAIPILEAASEWYALKWLYLRASIKGGYAVQFAGDADDNMPKSEQMVFSSGLGFPLGPFSIDTVIQYSLWQSGPYFIGGAPGLFAGVSLSYNWGEKAAGVAAAEAAPAAKPTPAEKPAEAPAAETEKKSDFESW